MRYPFRQREGFFAFRQAAWGATGSKAASAQAHGLFPDQPDAGVFLKELALASRRRKPAVVIIPHLSDPRQAPFFLSLTSSVSLSGLIPAARRVASRFMLGNGRPRFRFAFHPVLLIAIGHCSCTLHLRTAARGTVTQVSCPQRGWTPNNRRVRRRGGQFLHGRPPPFLVLASCICLVVRRWGRHWSSPVVIIAHGVPGADQRIPRHFELRYSHHTLFAA